MLHFVGGTLEHFCEISGQSRNGRNKQRNLSVLCTRNLEQIALGNKELIYNKQMFLSGGVERNWLPSLRRLTQFSDELIVCFVYFVYTFFAGERGLTIITFY